MGICVDSKLCLVVKGDKPSYWEKVIEILEDEEIETWELLERAGEFPCADLLQQDLDRYNKNAKEIGLELVFDVITHGNFYTGELAHVIGANIDDDMLNDMLDILSKAEKLPFETKLKKFSSLM